MQTIEVTGMTECKACSHGHGAHEHLRSGTDCSLCDCAKFRRPHFFFAPRLPQWRTAATTEHADQSRITAA